MVQQDVGPLQSRPISREVQAGPHDTSDAILSPSIGSDPAVIQRETCSQQSSPASNEIQAVSPQTSDPILRQRGGSHPAMIQRVSGSPQSSPASSEIQAEPPQASEAILSLSIGSQPAMIQRVSGSQQSSPASSESQAVSPQTSDPILPQRGGSHPAMIQRVSGSPQSSPASSESQAVSPQTSDPILPQSIGSYPALIQRVTGSQQSSPASSESNVGPGRAPGAISPLVEASQAASIGPDLHSTVTETSTRFGSRAGANPAPPIIQRHLDQGRAESSIERVTEPGISRPPERPKAAARQIWSRDEARVFLSPVNLASVPKQVASLGPSEPLTRGLSTSIDPARPSERSTQDVVAGSVQRKAKLGATDGRGASDASEESIAGVNTSHETHTRSVEMVQPHLESGQASPAASGLGISASSTDIRYTEPPMEFRVASGGVEGLGRPLLQHVELLKGSSPSSESGAVQRHPLLSPQNGSPGRGESARTKPGMVQQKSEAVEPGLIDSGNPDTTGGHFPSAEMVQLDILASEPVTPGWNGSVEPAEAAGAESLKRKLVPLEMVQRRLELGGYVQHSAPSVTGSQSSRATEEESTPSSGMEAPTPSVSSPKMIQRQTKGGEQTKRTESAPSSSSLSTTPSSHSKAGRLAGPETLMHKDVYSIHFPQEEKPATASITVDAEPKSGTMPIIQRLPVIQSSSVDTSDGQSNSEGQRMDHQSANQAAAPVAQFPQAPSSPIISRRFEGESSTGVRRLPIVHGVHPIQRSFDGTDRRPPGGRPTGAGIHLARLSQSSAPIEQNVSNGSQRGSAIVSRTPVPGVADGPNPAPPPPPPAATSGRPAAENIDISALADQVYQMLIRRLSSERQRKGV